MLQVTYNYFGEPHMISLNPTKFYKRGKNRIVFECDSFANGSKWGRYSIVVRRKSISLDKERGNSPDTMYGRIKFKVCFIK